LSLPGKIAFFVSSVEDVQLLVSCYAADIRFLQPPFTAKQKQTHPAYIIVTPPVILRQPRPRIITLFALSRWFVCLVAQSLPNARWSPPPLMPLAGQFVFHYQRMSGDHEPRLPQLTICCPHYRNTGYDAFRRHVDAVLPRLPFPVVDEARYTPGCHWFFDPCC